jgi:hypothetical protein
VPIGSWLPFALGVLPGTPRRDGRHRERGASGSACRAALDLVPSCR